MGECVKYSPEEHNERRREVKSRQQAHAHAAVAHRETEEDREEFECDFEGVFTKKTQEALAEIAQKHEYVTAGHIYQLVQEDHNLVQIQLTGPVPALEALNQLGSVVVARPFAFRSIEEVFKKDAETGEMVPSLHEERTPMKVRSVLVPIGNGYAIKFKYNSFRKCLVVC